MKLLHNKIFIAIMTTIGFIVVIGTVLLVVNINHHKKNNTAESPGPIAIEEVPIIEEEQIDVPDDESEISIEDLPEENLEEKNLDNIENKVTTSPSTSPKAVTGTTPYYVKVNYTANVVTIYGKDSNGSYTVPIKAMICSTGTSTPRSGRYKTSGKWRWIALFGGVYGQYSTRIVGNILFHSVPYLRNYDPASLEYWEYDKLGTSASMGCVRLSVIDAKWVYENIGSGTIVEFYSDSNPGPLGKPGAQKISGNVECRNWDPTDPDANNPWKKLITAVSTTPSTTPSASPNSVSTPTVSPSTTPSPTTSTSPAVTSTPQTSPTGEDSPSVTPTPSPDTEEDDDIPNEQEDLDDSDIADEI